LAADLSLWSADDVSMMKAPPSAAAAAAAAKQELCH
jgi:hypothetical protein